MKEGNRELNVEEMASLSYITSSLVVELVQRTKMLPARMVLHWVRQVSSEVWCGHALVVWLTTPVFAAGPSTSACPPPPVSALSFMTPGISPELAVHSPVLNGGWGFINELFRLATEPRTPSPLMLLPSGTRVYGRHSDAGSSTKQSLTSCQFAGLGCRRLPPKQDLRTATAIDRQF